MCEQFAQLRCKEVICLGNGQRLGYVCDLRIEIPEGCVTALVVPGKCRFFGLLDSKEEYVIPWHCIRRIGPDIILVDIKPEACCVPCKKPGFF